MTNEEIKLEELWDYISSMVGFEPKQLEIQNAIREFVKLKEKALLEAWKKDVGEWAEEKLGRASYQQEYGGLMTAGEHRNNGRLEGQRIFISDLLSLLKDYNLEK